MFQASCAWWRPLWYFLFVLLFSARSGGMREARYGSIMPPIIHYLFIYYYLIYYLVFAAAACVKHPAQHANIFCLFNLLFIVYFLFSVCRLVAADLWRISMWSLCGQLLPQSLAARMLPDICVPPKHSCSPSSFVIYETMFCTPCCAVVIIIIQQPPCWAKVIMIILRPADPRVIAQQLLL
jgi:hypothetical protein